MTCFLTSNSNSIRIGASLCDLFALVSGCDEQMPCTASIRTAVVVYMLAADGRPVDSVTATNSHEAACESGRASSSGVVSYPCWEQGTGSYEVRVTSGEQTWTKEVSVTADGCHIQTSNELFFELTDESADWGSLIF